MSEGQGSSARIKYLRELYHPDREQKVNSREITKLFLAKVLLGNTKRGILTIERRGNEG